MQPSPACLALIRHFEQCRLEAYWDSLGQVFTIGWGHTGPDVYEGLKWTQEQADEALERDAQEACDAVLELIYLDMTQGELDALTDFVFNEGASRLRTSTLREMFNAGNPEAAGQQLLRWDWAGGRLSSDLALRRHAELQLWNS